MKLTRVVVIAVCLVVTIPSVHAEIFVKDFEKVKSSDNFKVYISGVGNGFSWANTLLRMRKQQPLFCEPERLALTDQNYRNIVEREINDPEKRYTLDTPIPLVLLAGLIESFPCKDPGLNP